MPNYFLNIFRKHYSHEEQALFAQLQPMRLFANLGFEELSTVATLIHTRNYKQGEILFSRGEPAQALYLLVRGEVKISIHRAGKEEIISTIQANHTFGHEALIMPHQRTYDATIISEYAIIYAIAQIPLQEVFQKNHKIHARVMHNLATIYNTYNAALFTSYIQDKGFFELSQVKSPL